MPFGLGPRTCVGMRFALVEIKIALVKILRKFEIHTCDKTIKTLDFNDGVTRSSKHPITVVFKKRESDQSSI